MNNSQAKNLFLQGIWEPLASEWDIQDVTILGEIPQELNGTFYRNGPNPQYVYSANYHMFEGDGMIHAITFHNGHVTYKNRWIRTEKFLKERNAGKGLFGGMRDFMIRDDSVKNCSGNTANTNVVWHHNKLLALNEGSQPVEIDTNDLTRCTPYTFNQALDCTMMAHPKIDPVTGELIFYSYFGPDFRYFIADKKGNITYQATIPMPFLCMMHDFAITDNFSILPLFPLTWDFLRVMRKEPIFKWEPNLNTRFAIIPRHGNAQNVIWFEDQAALGFHVVNAREKGGQIILEMVVMDEIPPDAIAFDDDRAAYTNYLTRWVFDLNRRRITKERLDTMNVEFPRIDERWVGRNYRHAFMNGTTTKNSLNLFESIVHFDMINDKKQVHYFGEGSFALEPIFVARSGSSQEGDGYLLSYVYREALNKSDLVILDAQHVDEEPVAVIQLPHRVPFGFHGCWVANKAAKS
jgi:carotenoid cleavage dioxygenase